MPRKERIRPELHPRTLVAAYAAGAFPMPDPEDESRIAWFSPDPRGLLPLDERFHVPARLRRTIRQGRFLCTIDRAFRQVMLGCADRPEGTWITGDFLAAYGRLHELGLAHSVEAWAAEPAEDGGLLARCRAGLARPQAAGETHVASPGGSAGGLETCWADEGACFRPDQLAGGAYGVALGGAFFAESMFHRRTDAGTVALAHLVERLRRRGFLLCDVQWLTEHLVRFGGYERPRADYLALLASALAVKTRFDD